MTTFNQRVFSESIKHFRRSREVNFIKWIDNNPEEICKIKQDLKNALSAEQPCRLKNLTPVQNQKADSKTFVEPVQVALFPWLK